MTAQSGNKVTSWNAGKRDRPSHDWLRLIGRDSGAIFSRPVTVGGDDDQLKVVPIF